MSDEEAALDRADMARLVQGHPTALDALMARHAGRLHAYLCRLLQNVPDAEDLAQETFARIYEHRLRFDSRQTFAAWLYTIATNLVRDRYRWRARHPESPLDPPASPFGSGSDTTPAFADPCRIPSDQALDRERAEAVRHAVATLPEDLRVPVVLAEFEDQSNQQIAAILGCSTKAVEMRLYRARQQLRTALTRWLAPEPGEK
ncbi:MAG: RNA polymerase sigma factor [Planctomycetota bacterium]|nr:RNA polymerase sigma factor [Planctomycetota bacterium]